MMPISMIESQGFFLFFVEGSANGILPIFPRF
jgi:hypothetical protein